MCLRGSHREKHIWEDALRGFVALTTIGLESLSQNEGAPIDLREKTWDLVADFVVKFLSHR